MQNLIISFNAIAPMFLIIAVGLLCRKIGLIEQGVASKLNNLVYRVFTPLLLFNNIYTAAQNGGHISGRLLGYLAVCIPLMFACVFFIVKAAVKDNPRRGALIHGIFRSNFVILGLPIVLSLFPPSETGVVSVAATVVVPMFNVFAVFTLETFRGGTVSPKQIALQIVKNPLIIGTLVGIAFYFTKLPLPTFLAAAVADMAKVAMPMGLLVLGAVIRVDGLKRNRGAITAATLGRLVAVPGVFIPLAVLLGFRGVELATIMAVFASPSAINSYTMAAQMGGDAELAAGIVVSTSALSCLSIFVWTFALKQLGLM